MTLETYWDRTDDELYELLGAALMVAGLGSRRMTWTGTVPSASPGLPPAGHSAKLRVFRAVRSFRGSRLVEWQHACDRSGAEGQRG
jgi:hypothetical protein